MYSDDNADILAVGDWGQRLSFYTLSGKQVNKLQEKKQREGVYFCVYSVYFCVYMQQKLLLCYFLLPYFVQIVLF